STFPLARAVSEKLSRATAMLAAALQAPGPAAPPLAAGDSSANAIRIASQMRRVRVCWDVDALEASADFDTALYLLLDSLAAPSGRRPPARVGEAHTPSPAPPSRRGSVENRSR